MSYVPGAGGTGRNAYGTLRFKYGGGDKKGKSEKERKRESILGTRGPIGRLFLRAGVEIPGREGNVVTSERYNYTRRARANVLICQGQTSGRAIFQIDVIDAG